MTRGVGNPGNSLNRGPEGGPISQQPHQGPTGRQLCALARNSRKGYNPHPTLHGVCEQETSGGKDLLVLLLDVSGDLLEDLQGQGPVEDEGGAQEPWGKGCGAVGEGTTFS